MLLVFILSVISVIVWTIFIESKEDECIIKESESGSEQRWKLYSAVTAGLMISLVTALATVVTGSLYSLLLFPMLLTISFQFPHLFSHNGARGSAAGGRANLLAWTPVRCIRVMAGAQRRTACGWEYAGSDGAGAQRPRHLVSRIMFQSNLDKMEI